MMKTTNKDIKNMAKYGKAVDVTHYGIDEYRALREKEGYFEDIACSVGAYGVTGRVVQGHNTGALYAVTHRSSAIYLFG